MSDSDDDSQLHADHRPYTPTQPSNRGGNPPRRIPALPPAQPALPDELAASENALVVWLDHERSTGSPAADSAFHIEWDAAEGDEGRWKAHCMDF